MSKRKLKTEQILTDAQTAIDYTRADVFPTKVPIEKMRLVWNDDEVQYTDEQLYIIRDWMYTVAILIIHAGEQGQTNNHKTIELNTPQNEKSDYICEGQHRRAG